MIVQAVQELIMATDVFLKMGITSSHMYAFLGSKALALVGNGPIQKAENGNGIAVSPYHHLYKEILHLPTINVVEQLLNALRAKESVGDPRVEAAIFCLRRLSSKASQLTICETVSDLLLPTINMCCIMLSFSFSFGRLRRSFMRNPLILGSWKPWH